MTPPGRQAGPRGEVPAGLPRLQGQPPAWEHRWAAARVRGGASGVSNQETKPKGQAQPQRTGRVGVQGQLPAPLPQVQPRGRSRGPRWVQWDVGLEEGGIRPGPARATGHRLLTHRPAACWSCPEAASLSPPAALADLWVPPLTRSEGPATPGKEAKGSRRGWGGRWGRSSPPAPEAAETMAVGLTGL